VTKNDKNRASHLDRRTTRQPGSAVSLSRRRLVEKSFGWLKQAGALHQTKLRGLSRVDWLFVFSCAAYNLLRLPPMIALTTSASEEDAAYPNRGCVLTGTRKPRSTHIKSRVETDLSSATFANPPQNTHHRGAFQRLSMAPSAVRRPQTLYLSNG
jgi:hypothetical protein